MTPRVAPAAGTTYDVEAVQRRTLRTLMAAQVVGAVGITIGIATASLLARDLSGSEKLAGLAQTFQVLDPFRHGFDMAEHHRRGRTAAQLVPGAMHLNPFVGQHLVDGDRLADAVGEDFRPAAGEAAHAGGLEASKHLAKRQPVQLVKVPYFRGAERMKIELRIARLQVA